VLKLTALNNRVTSESIESVTIADKTFPVEKPTVSYTIAQRLLLNAKSTDEGKELFEVKLRKAARFRYTNHVAGETLFTLVDGSKIRRYHANNSYRVEY
jgi:hypothetical protein